MKLFALAVLVAVLGLPHVAAADVIDDFTLVGGGDTISFSEPATTVIPDQPHALFVGGTVQGTINGAPGNVDMLFQVIPIVVPGSVQIFSPVLPSLPLIGLGNPYLFLPLYGPAVDTVVSIPNPNRQTSSDPLDLLEVTFTPGVYTFSDVNVAGFGDPFSLTITQEATPVGATPEPGTLALLSTGLAIGWRVLRQRMVA